MEHHVELEAFGPAEVEAQHFAANLEVPRRADRQVFGKALDYAEYECVDYVHALFLFAERQAAWVDDDGGSHGHET